MRTRRIKNKLRRIALFTLLFFVFEVVPVPLWTPWAPAELYMHIGGKVTDAETGQPVSNLTIIAINQANITKEPVSGKTFTDGRYSICCVPPGAYVLLIDQQSPYIREQPHKEVTVIRGKNTVNADFVVKKGKSVSGKVYASDGVTPATQAAVVAELQADGEQDITFSVADAQGSYTLQGLQPGKTYRIYAATEDLSAVHRDIQAPLSESVLPNVNFTLGNPKTKISGTIQSNGQNIKTAVVRVMGENVRGYATTDEQGNYHISGLAPGTYVLTVEAAGYQPFGQADIQVQREQTQVSNVSLEPIDSANAIPPANVSKKSNALTFVSLRYGFGLEVAYAQSGLEFVYQPGAGIWYGLAVVVLYVLVVSVLSKAGYDVAEIYDAIKFRVKEKSKCETLEEQARHEPYPISRKQRIKTVTCKRISITPLDDGRFECFYECEIRIDGQLVGKTQTRKIAVNPEIECPETLPPEITFLPG